MKRLLFICLLFGMLAWDFANAQQYATLLNPNSAANFVPFSTTTTRKLLTLYRPSDFTNPLPSGAISRIYLASASGSGGGTFSNFTVRLGQTPDTVLSSTNFPTLATYRQSNLVIASVSSNAFVPIDLTTNFPFDSTQSLLVEISYEARIAGSGFSVRSNTLTGLNIGLTAADQANNTGSYSAAQRTLGLDFVSLPERDAALTGLLSPSVPYAAGATNPVAVQLANFGTAAISQLVLNYQYGNRPVVTETFTTSLAPFSTTSLSFTQLLTLPAANDSNLVVWVSQVNGAADGNSNNDTLTQFVCLPLMGPSYTVGSPTADFPTLAAAIDRLNCSGVGANVAFNLLPGSYAGSFSIDNLPGAGFNVTFQPAAGAGSVQLYQGNLVNLPIFSVTNESNVEFIGLHWIRTSAPTSSTPLLFLGSGTQYVVNGNTFIDSSLSSSANNRALVVENSNQTNVANNTYRGFGGAIWLNNTQINPMQANQLVANQFENYLNTAVQANNQELLQLANNRFNQYAGPANGGAAVQLNEMRLARIEANRWSGILPRIAANFIDFNGAQGELNVIANNEVSGQTSTNGGTNNAVAGFFIGGNANQGNDRLLVANNAFYLDARGTSTSTAQGVVVVDGNNLFASLELKNNIIASFEESVQSPNNLALLTVSHAATLDSITASNNVYFRPGGVDQQALFRVNNPANSYITFSSWQSGSGQDTASLFVNPIFQADSLLIPFSAAIDNIALPLNEVTTDLTGAARSITPDPGAYEFIGASLSVIQPQPLPDTVSLNNRTVLVNITDSTGLVTGTNGPRLYYRKVGQAVFAVDSNPSQTGNTFGFVFNYTQIGGVASGDTIEYYFATLNNGGTVTTLPLGGSGVSPLGSNAPAALLRYRLVPAASGTYTVGVNGDFTSITAAAAFINAAFFTADATFTLIDTSYGLAETFPIVFTANSSRSDTVRAIIRPAIGVNVRINQALSVNTPSIFRFDDANHLVLDGSWTNDTLLHWEIAASNAPANTALIWFNGSDGVGNHAVNLRRLQLSGNGDALTQHYAIFGAANTISSTALGSNKKLIIEHNHINRIAQGIYFRGLPNDPVDSLQIRNNFFGSDSVANAVRLRGIELHTTENVRISGNTMRNILCDLTTVSPAGVDIQGPHTGLVITANDIRSVRSFATSGITQGAYGINVNGGTGVVISNNVVVDMTTRNAGNSSTSQPAGIRLQSGTGHRILYNTVHLNGVHSQTTGGAASGALLVTSTAVSGIEVKNNIFANTMYTPSTSTTYFAAVWLPQNYNFTTNNFDHNAYFVSDSTQNLVARFGTFLSQVFCPTLDDFLIRSQVGNPGNDVNSIPLGAKTPPTFTSATDLRPDISIPTLLESGGVFIAGIDSPNVDILGNVRPAFGGTAPDMGAYEFAGSRAADALAPRFDSLSISPVAAQCQPTNRTLQVWISDNSPVDSVFVYRAVNNGPRIQQNMTFVSGRSDSGLWQASIAAALAGEKVHLYVRAVDSLGNSTPVWRIFTFVDGGLQLARQLPDTIFSSAAGATLALSNSSNAGGLVISENFFSTLSNGAQTSYPAGFPTDLTMTALEISNTSLQPVDLSGLQLRVEGLVPYTYNLPNIVLHNQEVLTLVGGNGTDNPTSRVYFLGAPASGRTLFSSTTAVAYYLFDPQTEEVVDAVMQAGHLKDLYSPISQYDFTGSLSNTNAGSSLEFEDLNSPANWRPASVAARSSMGTYNSQLIYGPGNYYWIQLATGDTVGTGASVNFTPTASGSYALVHEFNNCVVSDTFQITLQAPGLQLARILNPVDGSRVGSTVNDIRVVLRNDGSETINGPITVNYRVNTGSIFPTTFNGSLAVGDTVVVNLSPAWTPSSGGVQDFCAFVNAISNDNNPANDTLCISVNSTVSVANQELNKLRIFPNPAQDQLFIAGENWEQNLTVSLFDLQGKLVKSWPTLVQNQALDISELPQGNYLLRMTMQDGIRHERISILR